MEGDGMNKVESGHKGFPADQDCHSFAFFEFFIKIKTLTPFFFKSVLVPFCFYSYFRDCV